MAARIEELKGLGLTQAANEKRVTRWLCRRFLPKTANICVRLPL